MPMLCELTTVLQYMVAIAESMALPPSNITFLQGEYFDMYFRKQIPRSLLSNLCAGYGVNRNGCILVYTHTRITWPWVDLVVQKD